MHDHDDRRVYLTLQAFELNLIQEAMDDSQIEASLGYSGGTCLRLPQHSQYLYIQIAPSS